MIAYADSSFIASLYLPQQQASKAFGFMSGYERALPFTLWHRLEVRNSFRLAVFHGFIDSPLAKQLLKQLDQDIREECALVHIAIDWTNILREADKIGAKYNEMIGCRSADLFHVAAAIELKSDTFLTFDSKQAQMARAAGLILKP